MVNFGWDNTRVVVGEGANKKINDEKFEKYESDEALQRCVVST